MKDIYSADLLVCAECEKESARGEEGKEGPARWRCHCTAPFLPCLSNGPKRDGHAAHVSDLNDGRGLRNGEGQIEGRTDRGNMRSADMLRCFASFQSTVDALMGHSVRPVAHTLWKHDFGFSEI